ncbi:MAG: hypothetical protein QOH51_1754 [Acidobacteriota bacterium]|nr:hypothetical protein [Acidobacteriota bacterium]
MLSRHPATLIICTVMLCAFAAGERCARAAYTTAMQAQTSNAQESFTAIVKRDEARFTLPVPARREWKWLQPETKENAREYALDVKVSNEGHEYAFGFFLWKFRGAKPRSGGFSYLIADGQKSLFVRAQSGHMTIIHDAGVKVKQVGDSLVITVQGKKNVARLFSGRPAEVTFEIALPGDSPITRTMPVKYQD